MQQHPSTARRATLGFAAAALTLAALVFGAPRHAWAQG